MPTHTIHVHHHRIPIRLRPRGGGRPGYIADYTIPGGPRRRIALGTTDPAEAARLLEALIESGQLAEQIRRELAASATAPPAPALDPPLSQLIGYYVDTYLPIKGAADRTQTSALAILEDFRLFCRGRNVGRASQITRATVDAWAAALVSQGNAPKTVHNKLTVLRACLNANVDAGHLRESPIRKWLRPTLPDPEIDPLEPAELRALLDAIHQHAPGCYNIIRWIAHTGNRPSDARTLAWPQIDLEYRTVERRQVKTKRIARYQINDEALAALIDERARGIAHPAAIVFTCPAGHPWTANNIYRQFTRALARANFPRPVSLKDLRHTFGYLCANYCHMPLPVLQVLMGHTDIHTTMRYVRPTDALTHLHAYARLISGAR